MLSLFNKPTETNVAGIINARMEKEKEYLRSNLERVMAHYRRYEYSVTSDHLLVQILQSLPIRGDQSVYELRREVEDKAPELARAMRLYSSGNVGELRYPGVFFGLDGYELIIFEDTDFDIVKAETHWEELEPVRFLTHPKWDLNMEVPNGKLRGMGEGNVVVHIHPSKLAIQYMKWRQREHYLNKEFQRTTMQFVHSHPLTNALVSQLDVAWYNLLRRRFYAAPVSTVNNEHSFFLNIRYDAIHKEMDRFLLDAMRKRDSFENFLLATSAVTTSRLQEVVSLPQLLATQQLTWPLVVARLPTIEFLLEWERSTNATTDRQNQNEIRRELRRLSSNRTINALPGHMKSDIQNRLTYKVEPLL